MLKLHYFDLLRTCWELIEQYREADVGLISANTFRSVNVIPVCSYIFTTMVTNQTIASSYPPLAVISSDHQTSRFTVQWHTNISGRLSVRQSLFKKIFNNTQFHGERWPQLGPGAKLQVKGSGSEAPWSWRGFYFSVVNLWLACHIIYWQWHTNIFHYVFIKISLHFL